MALFRIESFTINSAAAMSGLLVGDIITGINGVEKEDIEDLVFAASKSTGSFSLTYVRAGVEHQARLHGEALGCKLSVYTDELPPFVPCGVGPVLDPAPKEPAAARRNRSYATEYEFSRGLNSFLSIVGFGAVVFGLFFGVVLFASPDRAYSIVAFAGAASGLALIQFSSMAIALADAADHARQTRDLLAEQIDRDHPPQ